MDEQVRPRAKVKLSRRVQICNEKGLQARAAAKFVKLAAQYPAEVTVIKDGVAVSGSSIMGLMMLAAAPGNELELCAKGARAEQALSALAGLVARGFDE
jgi:phosphocarrier protein HPr